MSDPYYSDSQDDDQDQSLQFDEYDESSNQDSPPQRRAQGQGSQPEWQNSNPNTQQDQWGQQGGQKRQNPPQRDGMNAQDPDSDRRPGVSASGNQTNSQYPRASPQASDDMDEDSEDWMGNTSTR